MNTPLAKLAKFLRLEADRGYDNRAVLGGLDRMVEPWREEALAAGVTSATVEAVAARLRDYSSLSPHSRQEALEDVWRLLEETDPDVRRAASPSAPPAAAASRPTMHHDVPSSPGAASEDHDEAAPGAELEAQDDDGELETAIAAAEPPTGKAPALSAPLTTVAGIGPKSASTLAKLGLRTLEDLLWYLPRRYEDYSQLKTIHRLWYGEVVTVIGTVESIEMRSIRGGRMKLVECIVSDGTGSLRVTWFNQPWLVNQLRPGTAVALSGLVDQYLGRLTMSSPEWEPLERQQLHTNRIVPIYGLTAGVTARWLRRVVDSVVSRLAQRVPDPLPEAMRAELDLPPLGDALQQVHFPDSWERLRSAQARLAFDEMLLLQLAVMQQKHEWTALTTEPLAIDDAWVAAFNAHLPYALTAAQTQAMADVRHDLGSGRPMNRLLQGDVGSGKTVIAAAAMGMTASSGAQAALLAPTSILADQHLASLRSFLSEGGLLPEGSIRLLIGATPAAEKEEIRRGLVSGEIRIIVGTHALLEEPIAFSRLRLAVIDEQHRFGVEQRAALRGKGANPHLLVMTATPIPRSLALTVFGDLDLTLLDEMPAGRIPIETRLLRPAERSRAYRFITAQLEAGRQAFVIYPLVEGSEKVEAKAAVDEQRRLQDEVFPSYKVGLLHGRLRPDDKDEAMAQFRRGELHVLVSTSVVEVGVDVPNATVMLIEGANRFGLAQLHQFRGRVGRGSHASYCLLVPDADDERENERLQAMESTNDGFRLAEMDLEQRGPGDFLGTRQAGFAELRLARLTDIHLIEKARREAARLLELDPKLTRPEHAALARSLQEFASARKGEIS
jgi:ATP-dependent DNA helicase RecG